MVNNEFTTYNSIDELIAEVEALGDWRDPSQKEAFFLTISRVGSLYHGYYMGNEKRVYPKEVLEAACMVLSTKLPQAADAFNEDGSLKPGAPDYAEFLYEARTPFGISLLCDRGKLDVIAQESFGINISKTDRTYEPPTNFISSCKLYLEDKIKHINEDKIRPYNSIEELITDVEALGDWRNPVQRDAFFVVLSKACSLYYGYYDKGERQYYPSEVLDAACKVLSTKFPDKSEVFDESGNLNPRYPLYSNFFTCATTPFGISTLCERSPLDDIAKDYFDIDIYRTEKTKKQADNLISSCKKYLESTSQSETE